MEMSAFAGRTNIKVNVASSSLLEFSSHQEDPRDTFDGRLD